MKNHINGEVQIVLINIYFSLFLGSRIKSISNLIFLIILKYIEIFILKKILYNISHLDGLGILREKIIARGRSPLFFNAARESHHHCSKGEENNLNIHFNEDKSTTQFLNSSLFSLLVIIDYKGRMCLLAL